MAVVNLISVQLTDDRGQTTSTTIPIPATVSIADVQAYVTAMLPYLDAITGAKITGASVSLALTLPGGLKAAALSDHLNGMGVNFGYSAANTNYRWTFRLPAAAQTIISSGEWNTGDGNWTNFAPYLTTGDGTVAPCDRYGNDLTALLGAEVTFRKS